MSQQIRCPHCGQTYELSPEQVPQYAGQTITCTNCQRPFTVPRDLAAAGASGATGPTPSPYPQQPHPGAYSHAGAGPGAGAGAGYPPHQQPQATNAAAVTSLIFAILGLFLIPILGGIVAVIAGFIGLKKAREPGVGGRGLAVAGLSVGIAGILLWGVMGCMISILLPSLNRARETANRIKCASNLRMIGQAELLYSNDHRGQLSPDLPTLLTTQPIEAHVFVCPSTNDTPAPGGTPQAQAQVLHQHCSYVYLPGLTNAASADTVVAYEPLTNHAGDGANFLFGDGHVEWVSKPTAGTMITALENGQNPPLGSPSSPQRRPRRVGP